MKKCKHCKSEIDTKAKICPVCKKEQANPLKSFLFRLIYIILVLGIGGFVIYNYCIKELLPKNDPKLYTIGERVKFDDVAITILSYKTKERESDIWSAGPGNIFYIVSVKFENLSNDVKTVYSSNFEIIDSNGGKYDTETLIKTGELDSAEIGKGKTITKNIRFAIPKSETKGTIMIKFSNGFLGDTAKIKIK